jgi:hypothetical protein
MTRFPTRKMHPPKNHRVIFPRRCMNKGSNVMRINDAPNLSKEMKALYGKFLDSSNFEEILPHIDAFIEKHPPYEYQFG